MKKNLIIFLYQNFVTKNDWSVLQIEKFLKNSDVIIYEFGLITNPDLEKIFLNRKRNKIVKKVKNFEIWKKNFNNLLNKNYKKKIIIHQIEPKRKFSFHILKYLTKFNLPIIELKIHNLPFNENFKKNFFHYLRLLLNLRYVYSKIEAKIYTFLFNFYVKKNQFVMINGKKNIYESNDKRKVIPGLIREYSEQVNIKKKNLINKRYILFLEDESPIFKRDSQFFPGILFSTPKFFYQSLRKFFDEIERFYQTQIIISQHPKSDHILRPKYFGYRKVISGKTNELVFGSKFVIAEPSMALTYAIKYKKRAILITSNENLKSQYYSNQLRNIEDKLGIKSINIDENISKNEFDKILKFQKKKYKNFEQNYLISGNKNLDNYTRIKKLFL